MDDEKLTALKKAYADIILDTAKEAVARVMESEKKTVRLQREIDYDKAEAVRMLLRLKQTYDSKVSKKLWGGTPKVIGGSSSTGPKVQATRDAKRGLHSWVEAESLRHLSTKYCNLVPPPRSTIAAAFSPDGRTVASTHGDRTVKILDCQTGRCLKVLSGHRRTPWVLFEDHKTREGRRHRQSRYC